jgi:cytochrome c
MKRTVLAVALVIAAAGTAATSVALRAAGEGNVEKGKAAFDQCAACHTVDGSDSDGPTLKGIFGRKAGALDTFRYSAAMSRSDVVWTAETLDMFLEDPQGFIPRNRMAFSGIAAKNDRDDLIAYLQDATKPKE